MKQQEDEKAKQLYDELLHNWKDDLPGLLRLYGLIGGKITTKNSRIIDLLDVDMEGAEYYLFANDDWSVVQRNFEKILNKHVKRVHIGTHLHYAWKMQFEWLNLFPITKDFYHGDSDQMVSNFVLTRNGLQNAVKGMDLSVDRSRCNADVVSESEFIAAGFSLDRIRRSASVAAEQKVRREMEEAGIRTIDAPGEMRNATSEISLESSSAVVDQSCSTVGATGVANTSMAILSGNVAERAFLVAKTECAALSTSTSTTTTTPCLIDAYPYSLVEHMEAWNATQEVLVKNFLHFGWEPVLNFPWNAKIQAQRFGNVYFNNGIAAFVNPRLRGK